MELTAKKLQHCHLMPSARVRGIRARATCACAMQLRRSQASSVRFPAAKRMRDVAMWRSDIAGIA